MRRVLGALAVVVAGAVGSGTAAAADCSRAELLATFDLEAARAEYVKLLAAPSPAACARSGFATVAERRREVIAWVAEAADEAAVGRRSEAVALIARALERDPANDAAQAVLDGLATPSSSASPPDAFAGAKALLAAGYEDEARENARKVSAEKGLAIPAGLEKPDASLVERAKDLSEDAKTSATVIAIGLALLASAVALAHNLYGRLVRRRVVTLGTFSTQQEGKPDAGAELKAVLAEELADAAMSSQTFRVVDAAAVDVPQPIEVPEQLKPVANVIQVLFRRPILTVSATARHSEDGGWQVTAQITGRRRVYEQATFAVPPAAGSAMRVVGVYVAAWAMFGLRTHTGRRWRRPTLPFGTDKWESFACVRLASVRGIDRRVRMDRLHRALLLDHGNVVALARLGDLQTRDQADQAAVAAGLDHLRLAADALERKPTRRCHLLRGQPHRAEATFEPLWFQITYARTIGHLHRYHHGESVDPPGAQQEDLAEGTALALELGRSIADTWLTLLSRWQRLAVDRRRRAELGLMLDRDDEYFLGVLAGALATGAELKPVEPKQVKSLSGSEFWEWIASFTAAGTGRDVRELLYVVTNPPSHVHADTLYNLACVWAQAGHPAAAVECLRRSFEHEVGSRFAANVESVEQDPTLAALRGVPDYEELLAELKRRLPPPPPPGVTSEGDRWDVEVLVGNRS